MKRTLTRRRVLAALGSVGFVALGTGAATAIASPPLTRHERVQISEETPVDVDWRQTYNGEVIDDLDTVVGDDAVRLENVLPGDRGSLSVRVSLPESAERSVAVDLAFDLAASPENGVNEPEATAGDRGPPGELPDYLDVSVWYDAVLACNGTREPAEPLVAPEASGTLAEVDTALDGPVPVGPNPFNSQTNCFGAGDAVCLSFAWSFDADAGNVSQGDAAVVTFGVVPRECEGGAPDP